MAVKTYSIQGYVNNEMCIELGIFKTKLPLTEVWDLIIAVFDDGSVPEGIVARRIKDE